MSVAKIRFFSNGHTITENELNGQPLGSQAPTLGPKKSPRKATYNNAYPTSYTYVSIGHVT